MASLYPEVMILDTTRGTNILNYPLTFLVEANSENRTENWLMEFLPDEKKVSFRWLLQQMLPLFLGQSIV